MSGELASASEISLPARVVFEAFTGTADQEQPEGRTTLSGPASCLQTVVETDSDGVDGPEF